MDLAQVRRSYIANSWNKNILFSLFFPLMLMCLIMHDSHSVDHKEQAC